MSSVAIANTLASEVVHLPQKASDRTQEERGYCWSFNVADQFPIQSVKEENNTCVVTLQVMIISPRDGTAFLSAAFSSTICATVWRRFDPQNRRH